MNPRQKMDEKEIEQYNMRFFQHNTGLLQNHKLDDLTMDKCFSVKERDKK